MLHKRGKMVCTSSLQHRINNLKRCVGMDVDDEVMPAIEESDEQPPAPETFIPGVHKLGQDEILEADDSVYIMRHPMGVDWPCLSFDILRDNLGDFRQRYPETVYLVTGTQADVAKNNEISVYKMSSLHKTQKENGTISLTAYMRFERNCIDDKLLVCSSVPNLKIPTRRTTKTMMLLTKTPFLNIARSPISEV